MLIIGCSNSRELAKNISKILNCEYSELKVNKFPDGELYVKFNAELKNKEIILIQTLHPSNDALLELIFACHTAKELGCRNIKLVIPYLAYIRQDKRFNPGEAVSSRIVGSLLSCVDEIITIDPHLHRFNSLNEVFNTKTKKLTANEIIKKFISKNFKNPVIIGPALESYQWAKKIALEINAEASILKKERFSSTKVKVSAVNGIEIKNKEVIIIDDIISTGNTILEAIKNIKKLKPRSINVIGIHGIFADKKVYEEIKKSTKSIITTNTIPNKNAKIDISQLIADSIKK